MRFFLSMFVLNFVWRARRKDKDSVSGTQLPSQTSSNSSSWCATASSGSGIISGAAGASGNSSGTGNGANKLYVEPSVLECTLPEPKIRELVNLPGGLDYNEWLASHTIAFFDHINLIYGTISEYCTMSGCPEMTGPKLRCYQWQDEKGKKIKVAAPQYIDYVMTFTQKIVNDETIFPTKFEKEFPTNFETLVKRIHRLLFHVIAHLYHGHFRELVLLNLHGHLNCLFIHFMVFNEEFAVIDDKETDVLQDLVQALRLNCDPETKTSSSENLACADGTSGTCCAGSADCGARHSCTNDDASTTGKSSPTPRVGKDCSRCGERDGGTGTAPVPSSNTPTNSGGATGGVGVDSVADSTLLALSGSSSITALHTTRIGAAAAIAGASTSKNKLNSKNYSSCAMDSAMVHNYPNASNNASTAQVVTSSRQARQSSQASATAVTSGMLGSSSPIKFQ